MSPWTKTIRSRKKVSWGIVSWALAQAIRKNKLRVKPHRMMTNHIESATRISSKQRSPIIKQLSLKRTMLLYKKLHQSIQLYQTHPLRRKTLRSSQISRTKFITLHLSLILLAKSTTLQLSQILLLWTKRNKRLKSFQITVPSEGNWKFPVE